MQQELMPEWVAAQKKRWYERAMPVRDEMLKALKPSSPAKKAEKAEKAETEKA